MATANVYFISELPHPEFNRADGVFKSGDMLLRYYENPQTIGAVEAGIKSPYNYPQVIVASDNKRPLVIIRTEQNASGGLFLCSLDANGKHTIWGEASHEGRNDFVRRAGEVLLKLKYGEGGRVELAR